jgi:hypothetical protein
MSANYFRWFSIAIVFYLLLAVPSRFLLPEKEIFPFFAFTLFTTTPTEIKRLSVFIVEYDGESLDDTLNVYENQQYTRRNGALLRHFFDNWNSALKTKDSLACTRYERLLFEKILAEGVTECILVKEVFSPYHKLKFKAKSTYRKIKLLKSNAHYTSNP